MKVPFTGGCACGAIRYECNAEPIMMGKCHCRDCQHISGGPFVPFVIVLHARVQRENDKANPNVREYTPTQFEDFADELARADEGTQGENQQ
jgi:hypothetical protein